MGVIICVLADNHDVEVHGFYDRAAGPHTWGNFEVLFTRKAFADVITWTMLNRPDSMSILCHPFTSRRQAEDHDHNALWLGKQIPVKLKLIEWYDDIVCDGADRTCPTEEVLWSQAVPHRQPKVGPRTCRGSWRKQKPQVSSDFSLQNDGCRVGAAKLAVHKGEGRRWYLVLPLWRKAKAAGLL
eukprot:jgi/Botrbrau1/22633/Bobra.176_1s0059.2